MSIDELLRIADVNVHFSYEVVVVMFSRRPDNSIVDVALGSIPADKIVRGGKLVNVYTAEIYPADVAIKGKWIAAVGDVGYTAGKRTEIIDASGCFLTPGLIDQHLHVHECELAIPAFVAAALPHGTTAVCTDFYGEASIGGPAAVRAELDIGQKTPMKFLFNLPICSYFQNNPFGNSGTPTLEEMLEMAEWDDCFGSNDTVGDKFYRKDEGIFAISRKLQSLGKKVCGHGAQISGRNLQAWQSIVMSSDDHEAISAEEAVDRARIGLMVAARLASGENDVVEVCRAITENRVDPRRFCFSTDLVSPSHMVNKGHIDLAVREAIRLGINPVTAIQMGSLNCAECLNVDDFIGAIAPGKLADILLISDLSNFIVDRVIADGILAAEKGRLIVDMPENHYPPAAYNTVKLPRRIVPSDFDIQAPTGKSEAKVRIIKSRDGSYISEEVHDVLPVKDGKVQMAVERDVIKIASIERVCGIGEMSSAFITGYGLKRGALATTYNSQQQNIVLIGTNDEDLAFAANHIAEIGGGFVAVEDGKVVGELPLPLFGLLSEEPLDKVLSILSGLYEKVHGMGCTYEEPFHSLGFMAIPVCLGSIKVCPKGLVDVWKEKVVDVVLE